MIYKAQFWLSITYFAFYFSWGVFLPYWNAWLISEKEMTVEAASSLIAVGFLVRAVSTFFAYPALSAKYPAGTLLKWFTIITALTAMLFIPASGYIALFIVMILFNFIYPIIMPMADSMGALLMKTDRIHYGKSRSWGSIGYIAAVLFIGIATAIFTDSAILYVLIASTLFMIATAFYYTPPALREHDDLRRLPFRRLFRSKRFVTALIICVLIQGAHAAYYNYGVLYLQHLGVDSIWIGVILNIAVAAEIFFFNVADRFLRHTSVPAMFFGAAIAAVIRWTIMFLFPSVAVYMFAQLFHALTFGLAHYAFIRLLYEEFDSSEIPAAQGVYSSLGMGLSVAILTFGAGYLYEISPHLSFLGMAIIALPAVFISFFLLKGKR
ncbi:3-phenylpropionic acid transporter [Domibacillus aminovorans]|uniref:3-phenylpropionic acid transporter n=1 Tax=Domibacillus aminovorans TaxID=29332 RepID=A0A177KNL5_9BACI|nr:MFS transporter [Domibacillus aminovorans]OAH54576.1 3-phenylpropionic acid transporter [Domibacillus aminovorans]